MKLLNLQCYILLIFIMGCTNNFNLNKHSYFPNTLINNGKKYTLIFKVDSNNIANTENFKTIKYKNIMFFTKVSNSVSKDELDKFFTFLEESKTVLNAKNRNFTIHGYLDNNINNYIIAVYAY